MAVMTTSSPSKASEAFRRSSKQDPDPTTRRHRQFNLLEKHWRFVHESYVGGPNYLYRGVSLGTSPATDVNSVNLWPYGKEGNGEYRERMLRSTRNNYSRKVVDQIRAFVSRKPPIRLRDKVPAEVAKFWDNADGRGRNIDRVMMMALQWAEVFGQVWVGMDKPNDVFVSAAAEMDAGMPFLKIFFPYDVLDAGYTDMGRLKWIITRHVRRADDNPLLGASEQEEFTVWDTQSWRVFVSVEKTKDSKDDEPRFRLIGEGNHGLGVVPFHALRWSDSDDPFVAPGVLDDIAGLDRSIFNKQSQLDTVILDQTFSQLVIPADAVIMNDVSRNEDNAGAINTANEQTRKRIQEMGTKRAFLYNGMASAPPRYIAPDATQAGVIASAIKSEITEVYRLAGLLGEVGREVKTQSGVSKAYDFDRLNKVLAFASQEVAQLDEWAALMALRWLDSSAEIPEDAVIYPEDFDVMGLLESLDIAFRTDELDLWSPTESSIRRKMLVMKTHPQLSDADRRTVFDEIDARLAREKAMADRAPLDPADTGRNPSDVRGAGGGARGPGAGAPTRPTTQQADSNEGAQEEA